MVGVGSAKVVVSFEAWKEGNIATSECQLPVVAPPPGLKREEVSSRLRQTLVHPDKSGVLLGLCYSADGRRLFAGHSRSGVVQGWDAASGRQLTSIETGPRGNSSSVYYLISPDGRLLYVDRSSTRVSLVGKDKRLRRWEFSGGVRSLDVETGKPLFDFTPPPVRGLISMDLSPDGSTLLTIEGISGEYESTTKWVGTLWDTRTGKPRSTLPTNVSSRAAFSPDNRTLLVNSVNDKNEMTAWLYLDAATGEVRRSIPIEQKHRTTYATAFSTNGKRVACRVIDNLKNEQWLSCLDAESGREIASFQRERIVGFGKPVFSPDGRMLAGCTSFEDRKLYLIDVAERKLVRHIPIDSGRNSCVPVFSPDGRWLAVISQAAPKNQSTHLLKVEELPQPHILLIEAATGGVRETIIAPPGVAVSLCFSPDGKTLASGGDGRVLLWDMTKPPGTWSAAR